MISVLFLGTLIFSVGGKSLRQKRDDWKPILERTGGLSGYVGAEYQSDKNWNIGAAVHGDLNKEGIVDGARIQGGYRFDNGAKVGGYVEGYDGGDVKTGVDVNIPVGKRSV